MKLLLSLIIIFAINSFGEARRPFNLYLKDTSCHANTSIISNVSCHVNKTIKWGALNVNVHLIEDIIQPKLDAILYVKRARFPEFVFINITSFDGCNFFKTDNMLPILKMVKDEIMLHSTNFPQSCPIKKNLITLNNMIFKADNLPSYTPDCDFRVKIKIWSPTADILHLSIMGSIEYKNKINMKTKPKISF